MAAHLAQQITIPFREILFCGVGVENSPCAVRLPVPVLFLFVKEKDHGYSNEKRNNEDADGRFEGTLLETLGDVVPETPQLIPVKDDHVTRLCLGYC